MYVLWVSHLELSTLSLVMYFVTFYPFQPTPWTWLLMSRRSSKRSRSWRHLLQTWQVIQLEHCWHLLLSYGIAKDALLPSAMNFGWGGRFKNKKKLQETLLFRLASFHLRHTNANINVHLCMPFIPFPLCTVFGRSWSRSTDASISPKWCSLTRYSYNDRKK